MFCLLKRELEGLSAEGRTGLVYNSARNDVAGLEEAKPERAESEVAFVATSFHLTSSARRGFAAAAMPIAITAQIGEILLGRICRQPSARPAAGSEYLPSGYGEWPRFERTSQGLPPQGPAPGQAGCMWLCSAGTDCAAATSCFS